MATFISKVRITVFVAILACCTPCSVALGHHESQEGEGPATSPEPPKHFSPLKVLTLERQSVMLPKSAPRAGKRKNFYSAKIHVGEPAQEFHVSFDLGGGTMVLPAAKCTDLACLERRRYDKWQSVFAEDIQANGQLVEKNVEKTRLLKRDRGTLGLHSIDVGSGTVKGTFVRDQVCVGDMADIDGDGNSDGPLEARCFPLAMLVAGTMSDLPFELEPYDGTVGLGLKGMSLSPEFNFLAGFHQGYGDGQGGFFPNSFGLHLGSGEDGAQITFGGYDVKRLTQPLQWVPVAAPQEGRWQVSISAIRVGNHTIDACRDRSCRAAIDYSASLFGVPPNLASSVEGVLASLTPRSGFGNGCQHLAIPDLHLELENGVTLTLPSEDFVSDFASPKGVTLKPSCEPLLTHHHVDEPLGQDVFILGESFLRRYYTFFNADELTVGFSLAASAPQSNVPLLGDGKKDAKKDAWKRDSTVVLLVQVKLLRSKTLASVSL